MKKLIEWLFPNLAWKVTMRQYFTTYYRDVEKVGRLTGRTKTLDSDLDWVIK